MDAQWLKAQFQFQPEKNKAELARALGLAPAAVSKILGGARQIKAQEYITMRRFFGLPSNEAQGDQPGTQAYVMDALSNGAGLRDSAEGGDQSQWVIPAQIMQKHTDTASESIKSFRVSDNMMAPDFQRDEHVLVDLSDQTPSPPGSFIVSDGFGFMLRNCEFMPSTQPPQVKITAVKDTFHPQKLTLDEFTIIGRVIAKLQWL